MTELIVQQLMNWMIVACIYTLLAIGFSLLFGVLDVIHFSHGDVSFLSPFFALGLIGVVSGAATGTTFWPAVGCLALAVAAVGVVGALIYLAVIRPFQKRDQLIVLVATVSLGIVLRQSVRHIMPQGSTAHAFPDLLNFTLFTVGGARVSAFVVVALVVTAALLVGMYLLLNKTMVGIRIRALAQDGEVARLMGVSTTRIAILTFMLASSIGAVGGIFFAMYTGAIRFDYGVLAGLLGFSAAVVGGLGSVYGAVIGAVILSAVETIAQSLLPHGSAYEQAIAFAVVIAFLVFRPTGILGEKVAEKV